jgi:hypothetical protein
MLLAVRTMLFTMTMLRQTGSGMISARVGRGRPKSDFLSTSLLLALLAAPLPIALLAAPAPVRVAETDATFTVTDEGGGNPRERTLRQVRLENEYLRVDFLPQLGGRLRAAFDKTANQELFLVRPIEWPPTLYTCYGSQLGGHAVNFPAFHHGNNYGDQWNWQAQRLDDGSAIVTVGWTEPLRRQRVVVRWSLRPGDAILRATYRFTNFNPQPLGFAPWNDMLFGYADDLQYIIPASRVAPHGFNDSTLELWPWPWPDWDDTSICFWRNIPPSYNSIFAIGVEENFHGVYYTRADHGLVRLFDRTEQPGIKMFCIAQQPNLVTNRTAYTEIWTSPTLCMEDMLWWEAFGTREYEDAFFGVHGIGGYRYADVAGALNLTRLTNAVEIGVCVTRPFPGAVIVLSGIDGDWLRQVVDLSPEKPWRGTVARAPGRYPLDLRVWGADGRCLLHYAPRPDPGLQPEPRFSGKPLWQSSPYLKALKAEQYHVLWRGPTGGYGDFGAKGARAFRDLLLKEPDNVEFVLGLARSLLTDVQLRQSGQPRVGTSEETAALAKKNLEAAAAALNPHTPRDARAAVLLGEVRLRQGDHPAARLQFETAPGDPVAAVELSRLSAAEGDAAAALRHSTAAIRLLPGNNAVAQLHAANLIKSGKQTDATTLLATAFALDPVDPLTAHLLSLAAADPKTRESWAAIAKSLQNQTDPPASLEAALETLGWR